jgi:hypothetical protein
MGTGTAVTALTDRITAAKMNLKLESVETADITALNVTAACIAANTITGAKVAQAATSDNLLKVTTGALAGGLAWDTNQIKVNLEASNPSLAIVSNELGIKFVSTGGLEKAAGGTQIKVKADSGLTTSADGIACVIEASKGLAMGASGLATVLQSSQGLLVAAGGLGVDYDNSTLGIVSTKLAIKSGGVTNAHLANANSYVTYQWFFNAVPISQTNVYMASWKMPAVATVVGATVWCTATAATSTVDITEGTVSILSAAMTPSAGVLVEGSISDSSIASGAELRVKVNTNGSGTITNCSVNVTVKFAHLN